MRLNECECEKYGMRVFLHSIHCPILIVYQWGFTALHLACQNGHFEMVTMLIASGADVHDKTHVSIRYGSVILNHDIMTRCRFLFVIRLDGQLCILLPRMDMWK